MESAELLQLIGLKTPPLCYLGNSLAVHEQVVADWQRLAAKAQQVGLSIRPVSAYRSFERQLLIWNGKAQGQRPVLDADSRPLDISLMSDDDKLWALLKWSAIPGCSRHHWGTDIDVAADLPEAYSLQLIPDEYAAGGPLAKLGDWLAGDTLTACGFARPFLTGRSSVAFEPWHISHRAQAAEFEALLEPERLLDLLMQQPIALKEAIARHWPTIYRDYVCAPCLTRAV